MTSRLQEKFNSEITPHMMEKFSYKSVMQAPKSIRSCLTWVLVMPLPTLRTLTKLFLN